MLFLSDMRLMGVGEVVIGTVDTPEHKGFRKSYGESGN